MKLSCKNILIIVTSLILLVGCSKPIDETSLIEKEGLMYKPGSDTPYTGEVVRYYQFGGKAIGKYEEGLLVFIPVKVATDSG